MRSSSQDSRFNADSRSSSARAYLRRLNGRRDGLALLLEEALFLLLDMLAHGRPTPTAIAEALIEAVQDQVVMGARLDLSPPFPKRLLKAGDQKLAAALKAIRLPAQPKILRPGRRGWPADLSARGSLMILPLGPRGSQIGFLCLWLYRRSPTLTSRLGRASEALGGVLRTCAEQAILHDHIRSIQELQQALLEVGASLDVPELQAAALSTARRIFRCRHVWFLSYNEAHGFHPSSHVQHSLPESALPVVETAIATRRPSTIVAPDRATTFACSGVSVGAQVLGAILLQRSDPFSQHELDLLAGLARSLGQGLRNARIYQDSQETFIELRNALDQLIQAERLRALGEIARGVAHDFNNLLTIISSHTQFLLETAGEEQLYELEQIKNAIREGEETVSRLREFTRAAIEEQPQLVSLNKLILEVRQLIKPLVARIQSQRNAAISIDLDLQTVEDIPGNPAELREMMLQMFHNSLDALPTGGMIWVRTWQEQNAACLQIRDDGVGMAEEVRRRVFDPFFTTKAMRGTGLGLSMVYSVIRRHGGTIDVESVPNAGTTFTIRLPLKRGTVLAELA